MIWREKRILLIVLGLLLAANVVFFFTYRVQYAQRLQALDERVAQSEESLRTARAERIATERRLKAYQKVESDVQLVYDKHWSTQAERLTPLIVEVKRLAVASSLIPKAYNFQQVEADTSVRRRDASGTSRDRRGSGIDAKEVGIAFMVEGTYQQVRRLINLLELSNQFVIIQELGLTSQNGQTLMMRLNVKTLFRSTEDEQQPGAAPQRL
ncbi:MAG TPA: hypothetical protein VF618_04490 [Thermoanaerobaculia bacterium]